MAQISVDDDRFRLPGSRYEREEVVALAVILPDVHIDWASGGTLPASTLWLPETLYWAIAERTLLRQIDVYAQTILDARACGILCQELFVLAIESSDSDVRLAATLLYNRARRVVDSTSGERLLVEGP